MPHKSAVRPIPTAQYRQGDVLLVRVGDLPARRTPKPRDAGRVILAYGEVTGHAHAITERAVVHFDTPNATDAARQLLASVGLTVELGPESAPSFLDVPEAAELRHDEHGVIALEPGQYVVLRQREWSDADEPIQVAD